MNSGELSDEASVLMDLIVKHRNAALDGDEPRRKRLLSLIEELEWVYPDADMELKRFFKNG